MVAALAAEIRYSGSKDSAQWRGHAAVDEDRFKSYLAGRVKARVEDDEAQANLRQSCAAWPRRGWPPSS